MRTRMSLAAAGTVLAAALVSGLGAASLPPMDPPSPAEQPIHGVSLPDQYKDNVLSFTRPGLIAEVTVKEGDAVAKDQVVAREDDSEEQQQLELDKAALVDAKTELEVEKAILSQDTVMWQNYIDAKAGKIESEDAHQKVIVDKARVDLADGKLKEAALKIKQTEAVVRKLTLVARSDGIVAQRYLNEGEAADNGNMRVLRIVSIDPMWVEARVPTARARKLKIGDSAYITLSDKDSKVPAGKVIFISPLASSANETIMVRIEVPNPQKLQPGENVTVKFGGDAAVGSAAP